MWFCNLELHNRAVTFVGKALIIASSDDKAVKNGKFRICESTFLSQMVRFVSIRLWNQSYTHWKINQYYSTKMSTALLFSAIVLAFRSDGFRGIFYDPIDGISTEAVVIAFFMVVIFREVASEMSAIDDTAKAGASKAANVSTFKAQPKAKPKIQQTKPPSPKKVSIEDMKSHAVVRIPEGLKTIEKKAFYGSKTLTWVEIPSTVTEIEQEAFCNCTELKSVTIKEGGLEKIGIGAFRGCKSLTTIKFPSKLRVVDELAFCDCVGLTSVDIQPGLKTIAQNTFRNCGKLTALELPPGCSLQFSSD